MLWLSSNTIVYNNYPWPTQKKSAKSAAAPVDTALTAIEKLAKKVLDARKKHTDKTLAWLYNPETMPDDLTASHADLDAAVDAAYSYTGKPDDDSRVAFLFKANQKLTAKTTDMDDEKYKRVSVIDCWFSVIHPSCLFIVKPQLIVGKSMMFTMEP